MTFLYQSKDFVNWTRTENPFHSSAKTRNWECPDFYPVNISGKNGMENYLEERHTKFVLMVTITYWAAITPRQINLMWKPQTSWRVVPIGDTTMEVSFMPLRPFSIVEKEDEYFGHGYQSLTLEQVTSKKDGLALCLSLEYYGLVLVESN